MLTLCNKSIAWILFSGRLVILNGLPDGIVMSVAAVFGQWANSIDYCYYLLTDGSVVFVLNCPAANLHLYCRRVAFGSRLRSGTLFLTSVAFKRLTILLCSCGIKTFFYTISTCLYFWSSFTGCPILSINVVF